MKTVRNSQSLLDQDLIIEQDKTEITTVLEQFSVSIPSQVLSLIQKEKKTRKKMKIKTNGPLHKQFVPSTEELILSSEENQDPIGDKIFEVVKGVIHRYPDRCLLLPLKACPVYCRFCFRRETVAKVKPTLSDTELKDALNYIATHPEIWEVILTGGDPLFLKPKSIKNILKALEKIPHVEVIRIHSRVPILEPQRIHEAMLDALKTNKALYISVHANHSSEFTKESELACAKLADVGIPLLGQTVLLKGINDDVDTLGQLMRRFVKNRIKPYYLHHADLALGTSHFRTTLEAGQSLISALRGHYSGLCQPTYVLDIPGGYGKVPICAEYVENLLNNTYKVKDYQGTIHEYPPKV